MLVYDLVCACVRVPRLVDAPILVSASNTSLWISPMYFHLAHWAKYVVPQSVVLAVDQPDGGVHISAFKRPDGSVVLLVLADQLDGHGDQPPNQKLNVTIDGRRSVMVDIVSSSISTLLLK